MDPNGFEDEIAARGQNCVYAALRRLRAYESSAPRSKRNAELTHILVIRAHSDRRG